MNKALTVQDFNFFYASLAEWSTHPSQKRSLIGSQFESERRHILNPLQLIAEDFLFLYISKYLLIISDIYFFIKIINLHIMNLLNLLFKDKSLNWDNWKCDYTRSDFLMFKNLEKSPRNKNVGWGKYMDGITPEVTSDGKDTFIRFNCYNKNGKINTQGLWTGKPLYLFESGRMKFIARFNGGKYSWPAIWLRNISCQDPEHWKDNYYEIDVVEHFNNKLYFNQTFHTEDSMYKQEEPFRGYSLVKKNKWNEFVVEWDSKHVKIWVNGYLILDIKSDKEKFPDKYYLILSMQYGYGGEKLSELPLWMDIKSCEHFVKIKI